MNTFAPLAAILVLSASAAVADDTADLVAKGQQVFTDVCFACHNATEPGPDSAAPPIFAAKNHYAAAPDRATFVAAVSSYVRAPSEAASQMPGAIRKFGLMPAQEITEDEAIAVAEYLYATDFTLPDWYQVHYQEEHGTAPTN